MKRLLFLALVIMLACFACSEKDEPTVGIGIDTHVDIKLVDAEGNDLLDINHEKTYNEESIKVYNMVDGKPVLYFEKMLTAQKGYEVYGSEIMEENGYTFRLFATKPNDSDDLNPTALIKWNETDTDTVTSVIAKRGYSRSITEIWFNGELMWEESMGQELRELIITK